MANNNDDEDTIAAINAQLEEDEREAVEGERLRPPPDLDESFQNPLQGQDVRFELPPGFRGAAGSIRRDGVPSNRSVASVGSVVAVLRRANPRTLEEIAENEVLVRKDKRGDHGSKLYVANRVAATVGLSVKFLGSYHLMSKNAAGENVQKAKNIQDQFVSNLDVMDKLVERIKQYDMLVPLQIPEKYYDVVDVEQRWDMDNSQRVIIDLSAHWGKLSVEHVGRWQRDFNGYSLDEDHDSAVWLKDLMSNSMDPELRKQVDEKYVLLDEYMKGGIAYFKTAVDMIFKMSSMSEDSLKSFMKEFGKNGLAKIPHENVRLIANQVDGVSERLADANALRSEVLTQYLTGLTVCSVAKFKSVFEAKLTDMTYLDAMGDVVLSSMPSAAVLSKVKEVSTAAKAIYDHLHAGNLWNIPGKHGLHANIVNKCDNCGALDHLANKCPKPRDEDRCKKAREARGKGGRGGGGRGGAGRGGGRGGGAGRGGDRAPWGDDEKKAASNSGGVMKIDGAWKMHCSKCGEWNDTHTTKYHAEQRRNAASFVIPSHHPYWYLSGKVYPAAAAGAIVTLPGAGATGSETIASGGSILGSLTSLVDRSMTNTESSEMSTFLSEMRNVLGN